MDIAHWPSRASSDWPDAEEETEIQCLKCKLWMPWFKYTKHCPMGVHDVSYKTFSDLGGYRWACDNCVQQWMRNAGLWTITDQHEDVLAVTHGVSSES